MYLAICVVLVGAMVGVCLNMLVQMWRELY